MGVWNLSTDELHVQAARWWRVIEVLFFYLYNKILSNVWKSMTTTTMVQCKWDVDADVSVTCYPHVNEKFTVPICSAT